MGKPDGSQLSRRIRGSDADRGAAIRGGEASGSRAPDTHARALLPGEAAGAGGPSSPTATRAAVPRGTTPPEHAGGRQGGGGPGAIVVSRPPVVWGLPVRVPMVPLVLALPLEREVHFARVHVAVEECGLKIPWIVREGAGPGQSMTIGWQPDGQPFAANALFPAVADALARYSVVAQERGTVVGWAFQVNRNYITGPHIDAKNGGWSILSVWGNGMGGQLGVEGFGVYDVSGKHLIFNGLIPHWVLPFTPIDDGARYAVVEFRFATNCPPAELETEVAKRDPTTDRRGGVLKQLLRYAGRTFVNDTSHLEPSRWPSR